MDTQQVKGYFLKLQNSIVERLEQVDGKSFHRDSWARPEGGGGSSCVLEDGNVLERGGVNFSHVFGPNLPPSASAHRPELAGRSFEAMGVSLVFHPRNPHAPTVHMNVRCFIAKKEGADPVWWFGGGMDLTPYYGYEEDAVHFHQTCFDALQPFGGAHYPRFKKWCDEYFYLKHRQEPRGIGGIFFDDFNEQDFASPASAWCRAWAIISCLPTSPSWNGARICPTASASGIFRPTGAGAMWNSTWCSIAAPCSASSPAVAPSPS